MINYYILVIKHKRVQIYHTNISFSIKYIDETIFVFFSLLTCLQHYVRYRYAIIDVELTVQRVALLISIAQIVSYCKMLML